MRNPPDKVKDYIPHEQLASESFSELNELKPKEVHSMKDVHDFDTIYLWEAMKEPDADKFLEAIKTIQTASTVNYARGLKYQKVHQSCPLFVP